MSLTNQIMLIAPYWQTSARTWVFDDDSVNLVKEPFVCGIPEMIDELVANVPGARSGFRLLFSAAPFPGYQRKLVRIREESGGWWYRADHLRAEGWLCPALFRYFETAPPTIYVKAEPRKPTC